MLDRFNRDELGNAIEVLVELLDIWDGDSDLEDDNEDRALDEGEPDMRSYGGEGAGCPISDDDAEHDGREHEDGY